MGEPNGGWRPWLMGKLARENIWACALSMPEPDNPKKEEWVKEISRQIGNPDSEVFIVGHSLGVPAILRYLENLSNGVKIGGAVLVSGPYKKLETENLSSKIRKIDSFFESDFDFKKIKEVGSKFVVIHGDDDPKVPFEHALFLSKNLDSPVISIPKGGHLNGSAGWYELPELLKALQDMIK